MQITRDGIRAQRGENSSASVASGLPQRQRDSREAVDGGAHKGKFVICNSSRFMLFSSVLCIGILRLRPPCGWGLREHGGIDLRPGRMQSSRSGAHASNHQSGALLLRIINARF